MAKYDVILRNGKIVLPEEIFYGDIGIKDEKIVSIGTIYGRAFEEYDLCGRYIFPGIIDAHTHFQLPLGNFVSRDTFFAGSIASVFGGVTTFIDFVDVDLEKPLDLLLDIRIDKAKESVIDYTFHSTIIGWKDERKEEIKKVIEKGVTSFKFFTTYSESKRRTDDGMLYSAFSEIAKHKAIATVHAENDEIVRFFSEKLKKEGKISPKFYPLSRPPIAEITAIDTSIKIASETGTHLYIVHISTGAGAEIVKKARNTGQKVYGETTPHYLLLNDGVANRYISVCPPLRKPRDNNILWQSLASEDLSVVATDHCPFLMSDKEMGNTIWDIPYGLPGVETLFPIMFTYGPGNGIEYPKVSKLLSLNPAIIFGLYPKKGALYPGFDADIIVIDPIKRKEIKSSNLHMSSDYSPYEGFILSGFPDMVFSRGKLILKDEKFLGEKGRGKYIKRRVIR